MKILNNIEQGSDEWLKLRLGVATASNFSKIITSKGDQSKTINSYALELASQYLLEDLEESFQSAAMDQGNELEPIARQFYQEYSLNIVDEVGFIKSDCGNFGYSPDGIIEDDGLIEIKCPNASNHIKYLVSDKLPTKYVAQVQGGLYVSGRQWCDFVSFNDSFKEDRHKIFIKRVFRDEEFIKKLSAQISLVIEKRDEILKKINDYK